MSVLAMWSSCEHHHRQGLGIVKIDTHQWRSACEFLSQCRCVGRVQLNSGKGEKGANRVGKGQWSKTGGKKGGKGQEKGGKGDISLLDLWGKQSCCNSSLNDFKSGRKCVKMKMLHASVCQNCWIIHCVLRTILSSKKGH